ncbi:MAG: hypothetical protein V3V18_08215 [Methylococcales bacterium]
MNFKKACAFTLAISLPTYANAYDYSVGDVEMSLHGFGSFGWTQTDNSDVGFVTSGILSPYSGVDSSGTFDSDTGFGLQGRVAYDRFSITAQVVSRGEQHYDPKFEWLYGAIELYDGLTVRGGRLRLPVYMLSESLEVGYSYNWVRPPIEVYNQVPITNYDGGDITYSNSIFDWDYSLQMFYGQRNIDEKNHLKLRDILGLNGTIGNEYVTLRAGYANTGMTVSIGDPRMSGLLSQLRSTGFDYAADELDANDENGDFYEVGFSLDYEDFLLSGEYTWLRVPGFRANSEAWYISTGYRIGNFTPSFTFSSFRNTDNKHLDNAIASVAGTPFHAGLQGLLPSQSRKQESITLGLRYDIDTSSLTTASIPMMAIKAEWQYINPKGTMGLFDTTRSGADNFTGSGVSVFSVALDFVF